MKTLKKILNEQFDDSCKVLASDCQLSQSPVALSSSFVGSVSLCWFGCHPPLPDVPPLISACLLLSLTLPPGLREGRNLAGGGNGVAARHASPPYLPARLSCGVESPLTSPCYNVSGMFGEGRFHQAAASANEEG